MVKCPRLLKSASCHRAGLLSSGAQQTSIAIHSHSFSFIRFLQRIDGSLIRSRECRYFHRFGEAVVHIEIIWSELNLQTSIESIADENERRLRERLNDDKRLLSDPSTLSQLPNVNDREGIPRYFSLNI